MFLGLAPSAFAQSIPPLNVQFVPNPLFDKSNFLPGDLTSGQVTVTNNSDSPQALSTEAINIFDNDNFGSLLHLTIVGSSGPLFDDSLAHFFSNSGEVSLGSLPSGQSAVFTFSVSFIDSSDNSYQGKTLGFDVCVKFQGGSSHCGNTTVGNDASVAGPGGVGGTVYGLGSGGMNLIISNEQAPNISNINQSGSATITWDTNKLSTSQVVYGLASGGPYVLNLVAANFGYPFGTAEDPVKVLHHSVFITGLVPGQTYVYRVVSRASPPTISFEHQLSVPLLAQADGANYIEGNPSADAGGSGAVVADLNPGASSTSPAVATVGDAGSNGNLAGAAASGFGDVFTSWVFWIILILLILLVIYLIWRSNHKDDQ